MDVVFPNQKTAILSYHVKQAVATRGNGSSTVQEMNDTSTWIQAGKEWKYARLVRLLVNPRFGDATRQVRLRRTS
jgi:hypothetical protein